MTTQQPPQGTINSALGIPVSILQSAKGLTVTIEMADKQRWVGTLVNVDDNLNLELSNSKHWDGTNPARDVKTTLIRGNNIMYVRLPEAEMEALFPMLKKNENKRK